MFEAGSGLVAYHYTADDGIPWSFVDSVKQLLSNLQSVESHRLALVRRHVCLYNHAGGS